MLTERLALRRFTRADAANLLSLDGDPLVMRFLTGTAKSLAQVRDEVLPKLTGCHLRFPGFGYWAAETRADGEFIGWFGLQPVTPTEDAMVNSISICASDFTIAACCSVIAMNQPNDAMAPDRPTITAGFQAVTTRAISPGSFQAIQTNMMTVWNTMT